MSDKIDHLQDIVRVARDGVEFYEYAQKHVHDPYLGAVFTRMAEAKRGVIVELSRRLQQFGEDVPDSGSFAGAIRQSYAAVRTALGADQSRVYIGTLEALEDRLLANYRAALDGADDPETRAILQALLPKVRGCHDEMRALKLGRAA